MVLRGRMIRIGCSVALLLFAMSCRTVKPDEPPRIRMAVMKFQASGAVKPEEAELVGDIISSMLQRSPRIAIYDRKQIGAVMQEQGFMAAQTSLGSDSVGSKISGVEKMIFGSLGKLGSQYVFTLRMVNVETSATELSLSRMFDDDLDAIADEFLPKVVLYVTNTIEGKPTNEIFD